MTARKRILIFIDWFTPGYKAGGPISSNANLIDHLSEEFEFYVITRDTDFLESKSYPQIVSNQWNTMKNGAKVYYVSADRLSFRTLIQISGQVSFDVVLVNGIYSLYFSLFPLLWFKYLAKKRLIISSRGMLSDQTFSSKKGKKKTYYALARFFNLYKGIVIHATNDEEVSQIRKNLGFKGEIKVASNLPPKKEYYLTEIQKTINEVRLVSIARISPEKNTLFALRVLEELAISGKQSFTAVRIIFDLYGSIYDQAYWNECKAVVESLPANVMVSFCGPVEKEKVHETLLTYHFLFMPTRGENYGHSVVECFMAGRPVIISDRTPWKNLEMIQNSKFNGIGWDLPLEKPGRFAEVIEYCAAMGQEEYDAMSRNAYQYAQQVIEDSSVIEATRKLFI